MQEIKTEAELSSFIEKSKVDDAPIFLFKHSTQCPISAAAYSEYQKFLATTLDPSKHYFVKVIESRSVSNLIEEITGIQHESPQALLFHKGAVIWNASHRKITAESLTQANNSL